MSRLTRGFRGPGVGLSVNEPVLAPPPGRRCFRFSGVHPNPTTGNVAAGADAVAAVAADGRPAVVAVGGGSPIDAAKGIAVAAVNPERGRDLDYRRTFARRALPLVAVPTTAGTGTETNPFGVITDPVARRKFYVGGATALPAVDS